MGYISKFKDQTKKEIGTSFPYKGALKDAKDIGDKKKSNGNQSVSDGVTIEEFENRYKGLRFTLMVLLGVFSFVLYQLMSVSGIIDIVFCTLISVICGIFYYQYSFTAWRARLIHSDWETRGDNKEFYYSEFNDVIISNPKEFFPIGLKKQLG